VTSSDLRQRTFDDWVVGETFEFGETRVSEEEIIAFARQFDPQSFHVDPEAARASIFGGVVASGWHTAAMAMRLFVDHVLSPEHALGSPGVDELRFPAPVRPGARLAIRVTVTETRPSRAKPDRGLVRQQVEVLDRAQSPPAVVMTMSTMGLFRRRPGEAT
jgi:acyl dehydratase